MRKKILCWSDGGVSTGFAVVAKNVLKALHDTDKYDIEHIAINYHGDFLDKNLTPWQMVPAKTLDPNDPYGNRMFIKSVQERDYDYIWIMNDTFVVEQSAVALKKVFSERAANGQSVPLLIYYYPVDCRVMGNAVSMIKLADIPVAYTEFGINETLKVLPELQGKIQKIYHGTDTDVYKPMALPQIKEARLKYFHIDGDTTLIINVNRNSQRKQLAQSILAFAEFRKYVPNSMLYLHTNIVDAMSRIDLAPFLDHLGLSTSKDVIFPLNYNPANGLPESTLNMLYNCADMYLTTHAGEGWGLSVTEAMSACVPVIAPNNTSMPEILGTDRGYIYPCKEFVAIDNSGYRGAGQLTDIVSKMIEAKSAGFKYSQNKVLAARNWVLQNNWQVVNKQWITLFEQAVKKPIENQMAEEV